MDHNTLETLAYGQRIIISKIKEQPCELMLFLWRAMY